jgi:hypothetical protein
MKLKEVEIFISSQQTRHHHENNNDTQKDIKKLNTTEKKGIQFQFQVPKQQRKRNGWQVNESHSSHISHKIFVTFGTARTLLYSR